MAPELARKLMGVSWMLKADFHIHTADDPVDRIPYTSTQLIDRAAALGFRILAITLHEHQFDVRNLRGYAADRGIVLVPGVERTIEGKHVLLLNFRHGADDVHSFSDLARLKQRDRGIVVAPHPFFPAPNCLRGAINRHADLFDAVEYNAMFTPTLNFNARAVRWAVERGLPLVGNGDVHRLRQLGTTYSLIDAAPDVDAICHAIVTGRVRVEASPLSWTNAALTMAELFASDAATLLQARRRSTQRSRSLQPKNSLQRKVATNPESHIPNHSS